MSNRLYELRKIEAGLKAHIPNEKDDLKQMCMRGDLYSLVRLIIQDPEIFESVIKRLKNGKQLMYWYERTSRAKRNQVEPILEATRLIFDEKNKISAKDLLRESIATVKERTRKQYERRKQDRDANFKKHRTARNVIDNVIGMLMKNNNSKMTS